MIRVLILAGIWGAITAAQMPVWQDNVTLWRHAELGAPRLARPALNLAVAYRRLGNPGTATVWLGEAWRRSAASDRPQEIRDLVEYEIRTLEILGYPACDELTQIQACQ